MDHSEPLSFKPDLALWSLLMIGVLVGGVVVVLSVVRRSTQTSQALAKLSAVIAVMVAGLLVIVGFFWTSVDTSTHSVRSVREARIVSEQISSTREESQPASDLWTPTAEEPELAKPNADLPEWTRLPSRVEGANTFVVVKSGRFASLEEAELHAFDEAGHAAARHFRNLDPRGIGQSLPTQRELVLTSAIGDRFEEISRHDFGTMKDFPMHQVWLQVKLNPQFGERFAEPWRQAAIAARLRTLTGWSVWGTSAAALIAFALRLDAAWNGRRRAVVVGMAVALMLGSLAFLA